MTRITHEGYTFPNDSFRIVCVVRGNGFVSIEGIERAIQEHDHFGIPLGMKATLKQTAAPPLVVLDAQIKGSHVDRRSEKIHTEAPELVEYKTTLER